MIGSCENCSRQNVPVSNGDFNGCETTQCFICQGDVADPYGEMDVPFVDTCVEHAMGTTTRLSFQIRVF